VQEEILAHTAQSLSRGFKEVVLPLDYHPSASNRPVGFKLLSKRLGRPLKLLKDCHIMPKTGSRGLTLERMMMMMVVVVVVVMKIGE
jgi:hypothetical protein